MKVQWQLGYFMAVAMLGAGLLSTPVQAQVEAERYRAPKDHLQCFELEVYNDYSTKEVELKTKFSKQECEVYVAPELLCAEASKELEDDDAAASTYGGYDAGNFLCHAVKYCEEEYDHYSYSDRVTVKDQFGRFKVKIKDSNYLCAPAEIKRSRRD
jgi:gamma-glutamylcyclotransferase (GGCT)/AIG2-like uncharacterized protein YtfP